MRSHQTTERSPKPKITSAITATVASLVASLIFTTPVFSVSDTAGIHTRRGLAYQSLTRLECQQAILKMIPVVIADARKPLKTKGNAIRLAADLQFLAKALALDENDTAAAQVERMALQLDPENEEYKAILADLLARDGQAAEATQIFSTFAIKDDTNPMVLKMLALQKLRITDPQSALTLLERFAQREDTKKDAWFQVLKARAWLRSGFNKRAAPLFQNAADLTQSEYCKQIWQAIAAHLSSDEDTEKAKILRHLKAAGESLPTDPVWQANISAELAHSDLNASREHLFVALASKRCYSRALIANATYLQSHGYFDHAKKCLDYYAKLRPTSSELHFSKARLARAEGRPAEAQIEYARGLELNPYSGQNYLELADICRDLKQSDQAAAIFKKVTVQCPNFLQGWLKYGESLEQQGSTQQAAAAYLHALTIVPTLIEEENIVFKDEVGSFYAHLATISYKQGKRPEALAYAQKFNHFKILLDLPASMRMLNMRPGRLTEKPTLKKETSIQEGVLLADALMQCKDYKDAVLEYRKAAALDPENSDLHSYLLNAITESGDWTAAAEEDFHLSDSLMRQLPKKIGGFFHSN
jgi:tetratricopeptide (TPR) repeat protein